MRQKWYDNEDQILEIVRKDHSLGLDSLFRVNINYEDPKFRIVAPFVEHALKPQNYMSSNKYSSSRRSTG
jgi:hypothetical protein